MFWDITDSVLTAQAEQALKPGDTFKECASCPEMVVVPAGSFIMGSPENEVGRQDNEGPQRKVTIHQPFAVGKFEITLDEWYRLLRRISGCLRYQFDLAHGRAPMRNVSWSDVKQYVAWIARVTGKPYRLLTEAEWEYVARAGQPERFSFGDDEAKLGEHGWYHDNSGGERQPVGQKKPNAFGLYDTHGNLWEWVEDCYKDNYNGAPTDGSPLSLQIAVSVSIAAVPISTVHRTSAQPAAKGTSTTAGTPTWVFVSRGTLIPKSLPRSGLRRDNSRRTGRRGDWLADHRDSCVDGRLADFCKRLASKYPKLLAPTAS